MAPGMEARCMPERMTSASAVSLFSAALVPTVAPVPTTQGPRCCTRQPAQPPRPRPTRRHTATGPFGTDAILLAGCGNRVSSLTLLRLDGSEGCPNTPVSSAANAAPQPPPEAEARDERTPETVGCRRLLGGVQTMPAGSRPVTVAALQSRSPER